MLEEDAADSDAAVEVDEDAKREPTNDLCDCVLVSMSMKSD